MALLSFNNVIKAYEGRIPGQMFTLIVNPGSITVFDFWKKFKSFKKWCIFCQSQNSQNKHYFLKLLTFFQKSKHSFWPRIRHQRKNSPQNAFFIRYFIVVFGRKLQNADFRARIGGKQTICFNTLRPRDPFRPKGNFVTFSEFNTWYKVWMCFESRKKRTWLK